MGIEFNPNVRANGLQGKQVYKVEDAATLERPVLELVNAKPRKITEVKLSNGVEGKTTVSVAPCFLDLVPTLLPKKLDKVTLSNSTFKTMEQLPRTLDEFHSNGENEKEFNIKLKEQFPNLARYDNGITGLNAGFITDESDSLFFA